jgi:hypothetical protein
MRLSVAFLNTVRTERFDQVLALRSLLPTIAKAGQGQLSGLGCGVIHAIGLVERAE